MSGEGPKSVLKILTWFGINGITSATKDFDDRCFSEKISVFGMYNVVIIIFDLDFKNLFISFNYLFIARIVSNRMATSIERHIIRFTRLIIPSLKHCSYTNF